MRVTIDAKCRRGLKIIGEIPHIPLCKLEGYNGIGKTSAIRLLQVCAGSQPFNDVTWRTFCAELISARIRVTDLIGAQGIEWELHPSLWQPEERRHAAPLTRSMVQVRIDGRNAVIDDVKPLLHVHHLNVTETPAKVLAARALTAHQVLRSWHSADEHADAMDDRLFAVVKLLDSCPTDQIRLAIRVADKAQSAAAEAKARASEARSRSDLLSSAVAIVTRLEALQGASPGLQEQLSQLKNELAEVDARIEALDIEIAAAHANRSKDERAERTYARASKTLERCGKARREAAEELKETAVSAGVSPTRERVTKELSRSERKLQELLKAQPYVNAGPLLTALLQDLLPPLDAAVASDLGERVLLDEDDQPWTVARLRDACHRQLAKLAEADQGSDAQQLEQDIATVRERLGPLTMVMEKIEAAQVAEEKLRKAESDLARAVSNLPGQGAGHLDDLTQERNAYDQRGRELHSSIDRLQSELDLIGGGQTEEELITELGRLCEQAQVDQSRLRGALTRAQEQLNLLAKEETQATVTAASTAHEANGYLERLQRVVTELVADDAQGWLRRAVPELTGLGSLPTEEQMRTLDRLSKRIMRAREALDDTTRAIEIMSADLGRLAERLDRSALPTTEDPLNTGPIAVWLAEEARSWFDDESMRKAMFDGGHAVRLNPGDLSLSWTIDGEVYERPLVGFSSGEQAFAYTRAQLLQLERNSGSAANRLIALDEFGAYLDHRNIADLTSDLVARQRRVPQDQVVVVLPSDLNASASQDDPAADRSTMLARCGYYAEPLQA
jgi:hypothetical protein